MKPVQTFTVSPSLPKRLEGLYELAYNVRWAWNYDALELFRRLSKDLWEKSGHNPVLMLGLLEQQYLEELAEDEGFIAHYERVMENLHSYMDEAKTWYQKNYETVPEALIAYFSAEFGITECIQIYSGGLGILAGDHLKSASELGIPLIGVGLLYQKGYFRQYLNPDGWQQERFPENDFFNMPIELQRNKAGTPIKIEVDYPNRKIYAQIWKAQVGRIALYLLDTNIDANSAEDRDITDQLYGGDNEMRIKQEIMLGIGGFRGLKALNIEPTVFHMNEGHSAFLALERIRHLINDHGLSFPEAREIGAAGNVFTTHTPVEAGHDYFEPELMKQYFEGYYQKLDLPSLNEFLGLGRKDPFDHKEFFCMTVLALRLSNFCNAVSRLHGQVSRTMWKVLWSNVPEDEIPISYVTNGVHTRSWISKEMTTLFDRYLGPRWREQPGDQTVWESIEDISAVELWLTHEVRRQRLVAYVRRHLAKQIMKRGGSTAELEAAEEVLAPDLLTIGFARRFATYKRATLILHDEERLKKLLTDPEQPIQIIFAGKAHPKDEEGKKLIRRIVHFSRREEVHHRIVFLEDYDMDMARYLVEGVDVWLNTPIRLKEASGTSGMKAVVNGALNLSILDGWWDEAYTPEIGWAIGAGEDYEDEEMQNKIESDALYDLLEKDVIPIFYRRGGDDIPREWVSLMKSSMSKLSPVFNTNRMVREYTEKYYLPSIEQYRHLSEKRFVAGKDLAAWRSKILIDWSHVEIQSVEASSDAQLTVGDPLEVQTIIQLGELTPNDVLVELYYGRLDSKGNINEPQTVEMQHQSTDKNGNHIFANNTVNISNSGLHGYTVRVMPRHKNLEHLSKTWLMTWADS